MWWLLAWIPPVICYVCLSLREEALNAVRGAARDFFTYLRDWVVGEFNARRNAVVEVPVDSGVDKKLLLEILNHLRDDGVGMVGIYGMGGIGKTALLREINNHFFKSGTRGMFNVVIWATVSREVSIPKIQKQIGRRLGLSFTESEPNEEEQAELLFQALSKKRFLLLLDDLWAELDLVKVGIPVPKSHKNCKVAFTTRNLQVCTNMGAKIVNVKPLDGTRPWELFCTKFSTQDALQNPSIQPLARQVVDKCGGLPLALITVGKAMANMKLREEWDHAIRALDHSAKELEGMDKVISSLKFSYDYLENDNMRSALLYCAMYREDEDIYRKGLIDHWIGEGLLDVEDGVDDLHEDIDVARGRGHVLIRKLQLACLLEAGIEDADLYVRVHDAVRDMALWISNHDKACNVHGFCVIDRNNSTQVTKMQSRGNLIRRIWVRDSDLERFRFPHDLKCPNICTLRVTDHPRYPPVNVLQSFFKAMLTLRVLDLSYTSLDKLPIEIDLLVELRYLNLSHTQIKALPKELGGLGKLRQLEFHSIFPEDLVVRVPREAIVGLSSLQVLNLYHVGLQWDVGEGGLQLNDAEGEGDRQLQLNDLEGLGRLQELHIRLSTSESLKWVLSSHKLCSCTRRLWLCKKDGASLPMVLNKMGSHLRELILEKIDHPSVGELRFDLNELPCLVLLHLRAVRSHPTITIVGHDVSSCLKMLDIRGCRGLKQLKFVGRFPSLELIILWSSYGMEEVMLDDDDGVGAGQGERQGLPDSHFPRLREISLLSLRALKSIGRQPLLFPSLQTIYLENCPRLRRLPLGPSSAPMLRAIRSDQKSWDAIEWDSLDIKLIFEPFLVIGQGNINPRDYDYIQGRTVFY